MPIILPYLSARLAPASACIAEKEKVGNFCEPSKNRLFSLENRMQVNVKMERREREKEKITAANNAKLAMVGCVARAIVLLRAFRVAHYRLRKLKQILNKHSKVCFNENVVKRESLDFSVKRT